MGGAEDGGAHGRGTGLAIGGAGTVTGAQERRSVRG